MGVFWPVTKSELFFGANTVKVKASDQEMSLELTGKNSNQTEKHDLTSLLGVHFYPQKK